MTRRSSHSVGIGDRDGSENRRDRGQFVLIAGVVVALALVAMLAAYLQLGYGADVRTTDFDRTLEDGQAYLDRTTHQAARPLRGEYAWSLRGPAVTALRNRLDPRLDELGRSRVTDGVVYRTEYNQTVAARWSRTECPGGGADRVWGPCAADRGVVVQERAGRTQILAVGYDVGVTTADSETNVTVVVRTGR
jgi:hypothetical protein